MKKHYGQEIAYELRCVIITCLIFYEVTYNDIEQKTGAALDTIQKIATQTIDQAECEDNQKILAFEEDLDRSGRITCIANGKQLSKTIQNAILDDLKLKLNKVVIDRENIVVPRVLERKQHTQSIIENV